MNIDKLKAEYQELTAQKKELTSTYKNCDKELKSLNRKLENLNPKGSFPTSCKQCCPQLHKTGSYTHCPQCRRRRNPTLSFLPIN